MEKTKYHLPIVFAVVVALLLVYTTLQNNTIEQNLIFASTAIILLSACYAIAYFFFGIYAAVVSCVLILLQKHFLEFSTEPKLNILGLALCVWAFYMHYREKYHFEAIILTLASIFCIQTTIVGLFLLIELIVAKIIKKKDKILVAITWLTIPIVAYFIHFVIITHSSDTNVISKILGIQLSMDSWLRNIMDITVNQLNIVTTTIILAAIIAATINKRRNNTTTSITSSMLLFILVWAAISNTQTHTNLLPISLYNIVGGWALGNLQTSYKAKYALLILIAIAFAMYYYSEI